MAWGSLATGPPHRDGVLTPTREADGSERRDAQKTGQTIPRLKNKDTRAVFRRGINRLPVRKHGPAPVPGKRRTAYVVPALGQLSTPIHDVLTASVDRCVAASSRPDQPNASPVASEGPYLPSRVITLPITKKSPILAELERPQRGRHRCQQCP
jgi:hypothetical protein